MAPLVGEDDRGLGAFLHQGSPPITRVAWGRALWVAGDFLVKPLASGLFLMQRDGKKRFSGVRAVGGRGGLRGMRGRLDDRGSSDATEVLRVREPLAAYSGTGNGLLAGLGFWVAGGPSWGGARPQHSWDRGWELAGGKPPLIFCWRWFRETVSSGPTGSVPSGYPPPWGPWPPGPAWSGFSPSGACPSSISYPAGRGYREMARNSIPACPARFPAARCLPRAGCS